MSVAEGLAVICPCCGSELPGEALGESGAACSVCGAQAQAAVFPALLRNSQPAVDEAVMADEAACYFHADRVAAVACSRCGRFLCQFCRVTWDGEDLCPACLEAASTGKVPAEAAFRNFPPSSTVYRYDSLALFVSTLPMITVFFTIITAPLALGIALFTFRKKCSVAPRTKARFIAAILISLAQIAGWVIFFIYSFRRRTGG
ncbi:MAG TPA: hypothetical protein VH325_13515 [Bryobacteraceae bacterium]|nr:hypothetical protein [Bryobacteraceae bacterium]